MEVREWFISNEIFDTDDNVKAAWLRAFFDDEATIDRASARVRVKSMNHSGLNQVAKLLQHLDIECTVTGPNIDDSFYLSIPKRCTDKFKDIVGFRHEKKQKLIKKVVENF